jgi:hypothetical protein
LVGPPTMANDDIKAATKEALKDKNQWLIDEDSKIDEAKLKGNKRVNDRKEKKLLNKSNSNNIMQGRQNFFKDE